MADASDSMPVKAGGVVLAGGGILGLLYMLRDSAPAIGVVLIGIVLIGVLLVLYGKLRALKQAGKDRQMSGDVRREAGATPQSVNSAESRAKLDDMRRKFQEGLDRFRQTGKSLYTMPWFLVVGESGSGKTEAIRRSQVPCPAGFQDPLQGAGGTVNMNWWFTNYGVILDTAGRLMLPEVPAANNPEWDEFLNLLNRRRPNCPINGLILVIPADTLLTATSEKIEKTAGEIAYQFDKIQRTLGIRFPVFVLITKCDKVMGFRQFFETINSPDEQAQMLGWSNPARLDETFNTALVDNYIQEVRGRLVKRRMRLLADPVNTEDPNGRRLDEVDALYQFPDALQSIAPRLRRYLEPIFVAGTWTAKPLFLRGIYFTSSLQTGEAVDKAISDILGVDVKATLGGPVVSEKSYFLRDTFMEKVFKEKGLVTRASDVDKLKRRRKLAVMFAAFLAVCGLGGFTWYGQQKLSEGVNTHLSYWEAIANTDPKKLDIVDPNKPVYQGSSSRLAGEDTASRIPLGEMYKKAPDKVAQPIVVPLIFKPMAAVSTHWDESRRDAYRATFEQHVMTPLLTKARTKMKASERKDWDDHATAALKQLILIEARQPVDPFARDKDGAPLDPLFYYVLVDNKASDKPAATAPGATTGPTADTSQYDDYLKDRKVLQEAFAWTYSATGGGAKWPGGLAGNSQDVGPIDYGVNNFIEWQKGQMATIGNTRDAVKKVGENLSRFQLAEKALIDIDRPPPVSRKIADAFTKEWLQKWDALKQTKDSLDAALRAEALREWTTGSLTQFYQQRVGDVAERSRQSYDDLLKSIPSGAPTDDTTVLGRARTLLTQARKSAEALKEQVANDDATKSLVGIEDIFLASTKKAGERRYNVHYEILDAGNAVLPRPGAAAPASSEFKPAVDAIDQQIDQAKVPVALRQKDFEKEGPIQDDCTTAHYVIDLAGRVKRTALLDVCLAQPLGSVDAWQALVQKTAAPTTRPTLPFARALDPRELPYFAGFDPAGSLAALRAWNQLDEYLKFSQATGGGGSDRILDYATHRDAWSDFQKAADKFVESYVRYWKTGVIEALAVWPDRRWGEAFAELGKVDAVKIDAMLKDLATQRRAALAQITPSNNAAATDVRKTIDQLDTELAYLAGKGIDGINQQAVDSWKTLGAKPDAARETLLDLLWEKFSKEYTREPADLAGASFSERYWADVCYASLHAVAEDSKAAGDESWKTVQKLYRRFPLDLPGKGPDLTDQQLRLVQQKLRDVTGKLHRAVVNASAPPTLATVQLPVSGRIPEDVRALRGTEKLTTDERVWIGQAQGLIDVLTGPGVKFSVTLHGPTDELRQYQFFLRLDQGTQQGTFGDLGHTVADAVIGKNLVCPGPALKFMAASDGAKQMIAEVYAVPSAEWSGLRLVSDMGLKNGGSAMKKWDGKLIIVTGQDKCPVPLTVEADQEIPLPFLPLP